MKPKKVKGNKIEVETDPKVFDPFFAKRERDKVAARLAKLKASQVEYAAEITRVEADLADWDDKIAQLP